MFKKKEKKAPPLKAASAKKGREKKGKKKSGGDTATVRPTAPKTVVPANVYTLVLFVAWLALAAASVLAWLDLASYK